MLRQVYNKNVYITGNRLKYPYMSAYIFALYLDRNLSKYPFYRVIPKIIQKMNMQENNLIKGIKVSVHGRLLTQRIVPRKTHVTKMYGTFKGISKVDKAIFQSINKIGHYTIRVEIAS